jgi:hypothetical protein
MVFGDCNQKISIYIGENNPDPNLLLRILLNFLFRSTRLMVVRNAPPQLHVLARLSLLI